MYTMNTIETTVILFDIVTTQCHLHSYDPTIRGTGRIIKCKRSINKKLNFFEWAARITPNGYNITISRDNTFVGEIQGATFNLGLEVCSAANRLA